MSRVEYDTTETKAPTVEPQAVASVYLAGNPAWDVLDRYAPDHYDKKWPHFETTRLGPFDCFGPYSGGASPREHVRLNHAALRDADLVFAWLSDDVYDQWQTTLEIGIAVGARRLVWVYGSPANRDRYMFDHSVYSNLPAEDVFDAWEHFSRDAPFYFDLIGRHRVARERVIKHYRTGGRMPKALTKGYVYLLGGEGVFKIGKASDIDRRVKQLGIQLPYRVEIEHVIRVDHMDSAERFYHLMFERERLNGEWFRLSPKQLAWIKSQDSLEVLAWLE